ncbi:MAG: hypothetical protein AAFQ68_11280, partial [Bacteroidota bacterium]
WQLRKKENDLKGIGNVLNAMGTVMSLAERDSVALTYYRESMKAKTAWGAPPVTMLRSWQNLANAFDELGQSDSSKYYLNLQMAIIDSLKLKEERIDYNLNIGIWWMSEIQFDSAKNAFKSALILSKAL